MVEFSSPIRIFPRRFALNAPLNEAGLPTRFYGSGPRGYTDYPSLGLEEQAA